MGSVFGPVRFLLPVCRRCWFLYTLSIQCICSFFVAFFSATIDGRNLIHGHKLHIGTPYSGKRFWTRQIPTSCLPKSRGIIGEHYNVAHSSSCLILLEITALTLLICLQSSQKTFWPTSHSDFLSCRIQESECKFAGPNKNKNNFTCLLLYQLAANCLFSHKNIKLFLQWLLSTKGYQFSISRFSNAN